MRPNRPRALLNSMSIGKPGAGRSREIQEVQEHVIKMALAEGLYPCAEIGSPDDARRFLGLGVRHFSIGTDVSVLGSWWADNVAELRASIPTK